MKRVYRPTEIFVEELLGLHIFREEMTGSPSWLFFINGRCLLIAGPQFTDNKKGTDYHH